ncbi:MAG: histone deacetylase [Alphaproteobacteria bacterium]|nr:histone deacetylase [Alphaproteobacteria bacterium]
MIRIPRPAVLRNRWLARNLHVWHHPSYRLPLASAVGAPADPRRADDALTWASWAGLVTSARLHTPAELSFDDAELVHDAAWIASLDRPEVVAHVLGTEPERLSVRDVVQTWRAACGGTLEASQHVLRSGGRAVNLLGGFHHAEPDKGGGFCALDDVAIAIARLRRDGFDGRVLVVDLDAHPPDGIVACLRHDAAVTVLSLSTASEWSVPEGGAIRVVDERVPAGTSDRAYLEAVSQLIRGAHRADLAFYLAGADPMDGDRLGGLAVSLEGLHERDRLVMARLGSTPLVILPAGGYAPESWKVLAHTMAVAATSSATVSAGFDPLRHRTAAVARRLAPGQLGGPEEGELLTEAEMMAALGIPGPGEPRFLGYYTRHGLEYALHAYGYLPTLQRLGFRQLEIEVTSGRGPDRMVITALVGGERQVLVDLAASIHRLEKWRVLFVEWLELRDPRVPFSPARPRLPGQQLPGLGMAEETVQLLVRAAERLGLDGVSFVPAHYHVAWMARDRLRFLDPEQRGRFEALVQHLHDVPLLEASRLLGGRGLQVEHGDPVTWVPAEMVVALDPGLQARIDQGARQARHAKEALLDRLLPVSAPRPERATRGGPHPAERA